MTTKTISLVSMPLSRPDTPIPDTGKFQIGHAAAGERLTNPFGQVAEPKIGDAPRVFRLTVEGVTR